MVAMRRGLEGREKRPAATAAAIALGLLVLAIPQATLALTIVRFEPSFASVDVGESVTIDVVADFSAPIVGFGFDLDLTSAILTFDAAPIIGLLWIPVAAPDGDGLAGLTFSGGIVGTGILLATIQLQGLTTGTAQLVASATAGDLTEGFALVGFGFDEVLFESASLLVVPELSTAMLVACGLALIGRPRRR